MQHEQKEEEKTNVKYYLEVDFSRIIIDFFSMLENIPITPKEVVLE